MERKAGTGARRWSCASHIRLGLALAALVALPWPGWAQAGGVATKSAPLDIAIERYRLANGLEVILSPTKATPVVAVDVWYHVGSASEQAGRSGFAHLFEHMMFQGSANVAKGEHMQLVERAGGDFNGSTTEDRTNYFEALPPNRLNLGLWLEADRMRSLAVTQANLDNQREVVKEEKRLNYDNRPYRPAMTAASYDVVYAATCPAYAHSVIGTMDDLNAAKLEDVQSFFRTYYAPNNATLVISGDFEPAQAKALVESYFGSIPAQAAPPAMVCDKPFSGLPRKVAMPDGNARLPGVFVSYGTVSIGDPDYPVLQLLATILGQGESSRLNERLVKQERAALQVGAYVDYRKGPGLLMLQAFANQGVEAARLQTLLEEEMAKLVKDGVTPAELEKARNQYRSGVLGTLESALGRAEFLQLFAVYLGDPARARTDLERYAAVTPADVQRVAAKYLVAANAAVVIAQPQPESKGVTP
jgi:predicted Zn-dependent peptidase